MDFLNYWQGDAGKPAGLPYQFDAGVNSRAGDARATTLFTIAVVLDKRAGNG